MSVSAPTWQTLSPPEVGFTALYSKTDGVVDWRACLDPAAEQIEVRASHLGMGLNAEVYAELGNALGRFWQRRRSLLGAGRLDLVSCPDTSPPAARAPASHPR